MIHIERILCPIDFSDCSRHALDYAVAMARWYKSQVTALHVYTHWPAVDAIPALRTHGMEPLSLTDADRQDLASHLEAFVRNEGAAGPAIVPLVVQAPSAHREILAQAERLEADLLVIGSHGRSGFERLLLGSITEKVLRKATCPVMVVPPRASESSVEVRFGRILCAVDFSESSLTALTYAMSLAQEADARLTVLHVVDLPAGLYEASASFDVTEFGLAAEAASARQLRELVPDSVRQYCEVETIVTQGRTSKEILRLAAEGQADAIVMGVQGRGAVDLAVFGSNTHRVIQGATCPVLTLREHA